MLLLQYYSFLYSENGLLNKTFIISGEIHFSIQARLIVGEVTKHGKQAKFVSTVNVLKFRTLTACQTGLDKQRRPRTKQSD